jgi:hypothetical protein
MRKKPKAVPVTKADRGVWETCVAHGTRSARALTRARRRLRADEGRKEKELTEIGGVSRGTGQNVGKNYPQKADPPILALVRAAPRRGRPLKLDQRVEAQGTRIACSAPPTGCGRWPLPMRADTLVQVEVTDSLAHERGRRLLQQTHSRRG